MSWWNLAVTVTRAAVPAAEARFEALGAVSVSFDDAARDPRGLLEPGPGETPLWDRVVVTALFDGAAHAPQALLAACAGELAGARLSALADADWTEAWKQHARPLRFGALQVLPDDAPAVPGGPVVRLAPGLAFGTGSHPSTALCLHWLAAHAGRVRDAAVIDFGCGSGILAIAALALGAARVRAIDHDPQAVDATRENARRNGIADAGPGARLAVGSTLDPAPANLLLANILAGPLIALAPLLAPCVLPGGAVVLAGILADQAAAVAAAWAPWLPLQVGARDEDWVRLDGTVPSGDPSP